MTGFRMPTEHTKITSKFGPRRRRMHNGLDIKVYIGDTIRAAFSGKVRMVKYERRGYGKYVVIRHENGLETVYGHLSKQIVDENQYVEAGEPIGLGGNTGRSTGSHLHFETRFLGQAINPALLFDFEKQDIVADSFICLYKTYIPQRAKYYRNVIYGMINSMRRNSSDAWYWDANNYTKTYCNNLQPLTYDYALEQVAMKRAAEIALSYSHTRPNGTNYYTAYSENGVYAGVYAENIGVNYSSASALHNAMREDNANYSGQEQRRNMLNSQFTAVGIGHVYYNGYHYWVEEFANTVTRTSYTTPNNQTTTVNNIQIAESNITSDQIVVPSSIGNYIQMSAGQTIDLSGCYENIKVSNHWPSNASNT